MLQKPFSLLALLALHTQGVASFLPQQRVYRQVTPPGRIFTNQRQHPPITPNLSEKVVRLIPRGGSAMKLSPSSIVPTIIANLQSGPMGILALSGVTWSVVLPLTLYKKIYGIGVAYGFSVAAAGLTMLNVMSSSSNNAVLLAKACGFYGVRLGSYLLRK